MDAVANGMRSYNSIMTKLRHCQLSFEAEQVLRPFAAHQQNLHALRHGTAWSDMVFYTIFMLPYRQALELVLTFIPHEYEHELAQEQRVLLQQAREWYSHGSDLLRHQLFEQAQSIGFDNPIAGLVLSVFLSEGSVTPPGIEAVYPPPWQALLALANVMCLILHFYTEKPELQEGYIEQFFLLAQGYLAHLTPASDLGRKIYLYQEPVLKECV